MPTISAGNVSAAEKCTVGVGLSIHSDSTAFTRSQYWANQTSRLPGLLDAGDRYGDVLSGVRLDPAGHARKDQSLSDSATPARASGSTASLPTCPGAVRWWGRCS